METVWPWPDNYRITTTDMYIRSSAVTQGRLIQLECGVHHQELSHDPIRPLLQTGVVQKDCGRPRPISAVTTTISVRPRPAFNHKSVAVQGVSSLVRHRADLVDDHQTALYVGRPRHDESLSPSHKISKTILSGGMS